MSHTATCDLLDPGHVHTREELDRRARAGLRAVGQALAILGATAGAQVAVHAISGSVALLADLTHNVGDALTAVPIGVAFLLGSRRAERIAGLGVVFAIAVSGVVAGIVAVDKLIHHSPPENLVPLATAGVIGFVGNAIASRVRSRAGRELNSRALIADGHHARMDAAVSAGVVLSAVGVGLGIPLADPLVALCITGVIGHIAWEAWETIR